ncbi:MAG: hypothetical protein BWK76_27835 [Desulfobulbaceae bacterium A2]|nr:MAG: hypothetical protein BWK76_27835 [Desulfobulbaceae bacterium A2]
MTWLLIAFFFCYGMAHAYFYLRMHRAFRPALPASLLLTLTCTLLLLSAPVTRLLQHNWPLLAARLAVPAFSWMALLFLFLILSVLLECFLKLQGVLERSRHGPRYLSSLRTRFLMPLFLSATICLYGSYEARSIRLEQVTLTSSKLPAGSSPITIAMLSDIHLGLMGGPNRLRRILRPLTENKFDLLVLTGDTMDGPLHEREELAALFRDIHPPLGTFAVNGNHEYYSDIRQCRDFFHLAKITLLCNQVVHVGTSLRLVGLDDPSAVQVGEPPPPPVASICPPDPERLTVLLKHRPVVLPEDLPIVDLQLSGHIHRGQIFPAVLVTRLFFSFPTGLSRLAEEKTLYVSRGAGTWGPEIRFLAPPEVTLITIAPKS